MTICSKYVHKKHSKLPLSPCKYLWHKHVKSPQAFIFFLIPNFQNLGLKVVSPAESGADTVMLLLF